MTFVFAVYGTAYAAAVRNYLSGRNSESSLAMQVVPAADWVPFLPYGVRQGESGDFVAAEKRVIR